jgi:predicted aspartyl protease
MSGFHHVAAAALFCAPLLMGPSLAKADCKLLLIAEFHLDPNSTSPLVDGSINGHPVKVALDTGADFSMITHYEADKLGLPAVEAVGSRAYGIGGSTQMYWAHVDQLRIGDLTKAGIDLAVAGDRHEASDVGIVIGDDVLSKADIEFDLAHNSIRMFRPQGCAAPQLVYWGAAYSQADLLPSDHDAPHIQTRAMVNGKGVLAELDSGAEISVIDTSAAIADGVTRSSADPRVDAVRGVGPKPEESWIGRFESFALGDEKIAHVNIEVVNMKRDETITETGSLTPYHATSTSMYIGDDFLRAHRVFIDNQDHLILFSYHGGPVFSTPQLATTATTAK